MKNKIAFLLIIINLSIASGQSAKARTNSGDISFRDQFFNNPSVIYNLKKITSGNQINILDSKKLVSDKPLSFKNNVEDPTINIAIDKNDFINYNIQECIVNEDLAFVVLWEYGKNRALWFFLNKGKKTKKWYLIEVLEKTTR
ncbi:hypothetical protein [Chryseobacterium sp. JV558]|uniref:hypothetical protein n=1 Tax=Chryseobacterium sp. JV558 TaxID=2663236 RepID=UPI00299EECD6|nr:hypothetical protein [Chryseobacterium sp. JV558]MDW9380159.1 hypothetical protein [Chryseobacterium sp. JV558]